MRKRLRIVAVVALLGAASAPAQPREPDATLAIEQVRVGVLAAGTAVGGGRLRFDGREHSFSVRGLDVGSLGVSTLSLTGEVFGLPRLEDFSGTYEEKPVQETADGPPLYVLSNEAGVEIRLRAERGAGPIRFAPSGLTIRLN
jgi:hypothetical protein